MTKNMKKCKLCRKTKTDEEFTGKVCTICYEKYPNKKTKQLFLYNSF